MFATAARDIVTLPYDDRPKPAGKSNTSSRHRAGVTSRAVCGYRLGIGGSAVPGAHSARDDGTPRGLQTGDRRKCGAGEAVTDADASG